MSLIKVNVLREMDHKGGAELKSDKSTNEWNSVFAVNVPETRTQKRENITRIRNPKDPSGQGGEEGV